MESFRVTTTLTLDDWHALTAEHAARSRAGKTFVRSLLGIAAWTVATIVLLTLADVFDVEISTPSILFGMAIVGTIVFVTRRSAQAKIYRDAAESVVGPCIFEFDDAGIHVVDRRIDAHYAWSNARDVSVSTRHIFVWTSSFSAFIVPLRDLPADVSAESANAFLRERFSPSAQSELPATPTPVGTLQWWKAIPQWWLLRSTLPVIVADREIVLLSLATLFLWSGIDRLRAGADALFNSYNIPVLALCALALLLIARVISKRTTNVGFRGSLFTVLAALPLVIVLNLIIDSYLSGLVGILALLALLAYIGFYLARALSSQAGSPQPQGALLGVAVIVLLGVLSNQFYWTPSLWYPAESDEDGSAQPTWSNGESLLFDQRTRIDAALKGVTAHDPQTPSNFFVGFAGVAEQKVFAEEIGLASRVIADRYDTGPRTLLLLNDRRDVDSHPLATVSGLAYALKGVADRMDVDRDILFLSLSSHGSDDPELQVSNGVLPLLQVTGENLVAALDASGIKYRVLIISACHAGAFIEPLQNENTIIITAAAKEKTSFGCSDDRDLTYFGEAFYRDALPKAATLRDAFESAKKEITAREKSEDYTPSDPQAYFGAALEAKLQR